METLLDTVNAVRLPKPEHQPTELETLRRARAFAAAFTAETEHHPRLRLIHGGADDRAAHGGEAKPIGGNDARIANHRTQTERLSGQCLTSLLPLISLLPNCAKRPDLQRNIR